jgi:hypothetical protein
MTGDAMHLGGAIEPEPHTQTRGGREYGLSGRADARRTQRIALFATYQPFLATQYAQTPGFHLETVDGLLGRSTWNNTRLFPLTLFPLSPRIPDMNKLWYALAIVPLLLAAVLMLAGGLIAVPILTALPDWD